ncbi:Zn-dependent oligopeptidase [Nocardioidaceae bacterium]|nr:Zn-dependent oligopeptidase [Nocardioidaceae bacterium]
MSDTSGAGGPRPERAVGAAGTGGVDDLTPLEQPSAQFAPGTAVSGPDPVLMPSRPEDWPAFLRARIDDQVEEAAVSVETLREAPSGDRVVLELWNDVQVALARAGAAASLFSEVHPDAAVRDLAEQGLQRVQQLATDLLLDDAVYAQLAGLDRTDPQTGADVFEGDDDAETARRVLAHTLRDFRRAGVDRDDATRARLRELAAQETELGQRFARGIRDGRTVTRVPASAVAALPEDWRAEHPVAEDGTVAVSTDYPDTGPFLTFSTDASARRAVAAASQDLGWPENDEVLRELLTLRAEHARLLGYDGWADFDAEVKMVGSGDAVMPFVDRIAAAAEEPAQRDLDRLSARARAEHPDAVIDMSSWRHWAEVLRREEHEVDAQHVRRYFDVQRVTAGLLEVTGRLFGLHFTEVPAASWHPEVSTYDVSLDAERIGRIHLDLHPREGKFNHAAQFSLTSGLRGRQLAEGVLVCNFGRGLMEHGEVVTLFHEFGHLVHHVLAGRHDWERFSGVACEWDFVEAPSQMLEEWAWDHRTLALFARDDAGEVIPVDLVTRMRQADELATAVGVRRQLLFAAMSHVFHEEVPADFAARTAELAERYSPVGTLPGGHMHAGFGHLVGYGPAYYTYEWSLVIAKDLFSAFDAEDLLAPEVARRYRDAVLVPGGSRDAAAMVRDFLGRDHDERAFEQWLAR